MLYRIEYLDEVYDQLAKILKNVRQSIIKAINERLSTNPYRFKPLNKEWEGYYRFRVFNYRVIYKIYKERVTVLVVRVGIRSNVYE